MWVWDSSQQVLATQGAVYVQGHCLQEQRLYKRLHCLQALGPLQEHTTFRESLVCYTFPEVYTFLKCKKPHTQHLNGADMGLDASSA